MRKHCNTVLYTGTPMLYTKYSYIRYTCMYNNDIHSALHGCVKCLITQVLH